MKDSIGLAVSFDHIEKLQGVFNLAEKTAAEKKIVVRFLAENEKYFIKYQNEGFTTCEHLGRIEDQYSMHKIKEQGWAALFCDPDNRVADMIVVCEQCLPELKRASIQLIQGLSDKEEFDGTGRGYGYSLKMTHKGNWTMNEEIVIPIMAGLAGSWNDKVSFEQLFEDTAQMAVDITRTTQVEGLPKMFLFYGDSRTEMIIMPRYDGSPMDLVKPIIFDRNPDVGFVFIALAWTANIKKIVQMRPDLACPVCHGKGKGCISCDSIGYDKSKWRHGIIEQMPDARKEVMVAAGMDRTTGKYYHRTYDVTRRIPNDDSTEIVGIEPIVDFDDNDDPDTPAEADPPIPTQASVARQLEDSIMLYPKFPVVKDGEWHDKNGVYIARVKKVEK